MGLSTLVYTITYTDGVAGDLEQVPKSLHSLILDRIDVQLKYEPTRETRNRKILVGLVPPWDYVEPVWELRVGEYRVFYDVDEAEETVTIRAIRHKPPHKATEEIV